MNKVPPRLLWLAAVWGTLASRLVADDHVAVSSIAKESYTQEKFAGDRPKAETYLFMQGHFFDGATVDRSLERMSFREIAGHLAPELAKQNYLPTPDVAKADLLLVVHWGTTMPRLTSTEMRAQLSPVTDTSTTAAGIERQIKEYNEKHVDNGGGGIPEPTLLGSDLFAQLAAASFGDEAARQMEFDGLDQVADQVRADFGTGTNARLLGYDRDLRRLAKNLVGTAQEDTLRHDLVGERYFVIVRAYDLHEKIGPGRLRRAIWTLHVNIRSPGHNFSSALALMGPAASRYFGRTTTEVETVRPASREGKVDIPPFVILGEAK